MEQMKSRVAQPRSRAGQQPDPDPPDRLTHPHSPTHPKRSPQSLIAPRRESPQQIKAAPRRAGPYEVGVAGSRGIGRGVPEDSFAPRSSTAPPPVRCE